VAGILRGSIYWADLNPVRGHEQSGTRPVVVLSHGVFNDRSGTVIAMAITSQAQRAGFPLTHELKNPIQGKKAWIKIRQIRTLSIDRIGKRIGQVFSEELVEVTEGLSEIIGD
jgi:mRNA interferase MazF